jgi:hypothetical protein
MRNRYARQSLVENWLSGDLEVFWLFAAMREDLELAALSWPTEGPTRRVHGDLDNF